MLRTTAQHRVLKCGGLKSGLLHPTVKTYGCRGQRLGIRSGVIDGTGGLAVSMIDSGLGLTLEGLGLSLQETSKLKHYGRHDPRKSEKRTLKANLGRCHRLYWE